MQIEPCSSTQLQHLGSIQRDNQTLFTRILHRSIIPSSDIHQATARTMDSIVSSLTEDEFHHDHDENGAQVGLTEPLLLKEPTIPEDGPMLPSRNTVAHVTPRYNDQRIKMTYGRRISRFLRNVRTIMPCDHSVLHRFFFFVERCAPKNYSDQV